MRCSDIIDIIVITRRHVGGILGMNKDRAKMRESENSHSDIIRTPCIRQLHNSTHNNYKGTNIAYLQNCSYTTVDRMVSLSPSVYTQFMGWNPIINATTSIYTCRATWQRANQTCNHLPTDSDSLFTLSLLWLSKSDFEVVSRSQPGHVDTVVTMSELLSKTFLMVGVIVS